MLSGELFGYAATEKELLGTLPELRRDSYVEHWVGVSKPSFNPTENVDFSL